MQKIHSFTLLLLRLGLGWLFFYAGITKVLNPDWSAAGYLQGAATLQPLFAWLASPENIGWVNFLNEWGLTVIGLALILGLFVRWAALGGIVFMLMYWLPVLSFPYAGDHSYIVDDHIVYILGFLVLAAFNAGRYWGLDHYFQRV